MNFEEWLFQVCHLMSIKYRRDETEIFSSIDLTDAKLSFLDGVLPENYNNEW